MKLWLSIYEKTDNWSDLFHRINSVHTNCIEDMKSVLGLLLDMNDGKSETIVKKKKTTYFLKSRIVKALRGADYVMSDVYLLL